MEDIEEQKNLLQPPISKTQKRDEQENNEEKTQIKIYNIYRQILILLYLSYYILCGHEIFATYNTKNFNFKKLLLVCLIYHITVILTNMFFGCMLSKNRLVIKSFCKNIIVSIGMILIYLGGFLFLNNKIDKEKVFFFMIPYFLFNLVFFIKCTYKEIIIILAFIESIFVLLIGLQFSGVINIGYTFTFFYFYLIYGIALFCIAICVIIVIIGSIFICKMSIWKGFAAFIIGNIVICFSGLFVVINFLLTYGFCWLFKNNEIFVSGMVSKNKVLFVTGQMMEIYAEVLLVLFILLMICCNKVLDFSLFYYGELGASDLVKRVFEFDYKMMFKI